MSTHTRWTEAEVAETLAVAAKHTGTRGEKSIVHWNAVAEELAARGGSHTRTASAIASHFAGMPIPHGVASAPHTRYGDDENACLLALLDDAKYMYMRGTRVCQ